MQVSLLFFRLRHDLLNRPQLYHAVRKSTQLIFGCGGLGNEFLGVDAVTDLLTTLKKGGVGRVDTAGLYPPTDIGASQRLLGQSGASQMGFAIDTKILISIHGLQDTLTPAKIEKSVAISYQDLNLKDGQCIDTLYDHAPDVATPLQDQARGFDAQYRKGLFNKLGVCNFPPDMLAEYIAICEREKYVKPSVYQGLYNFIDRRHEGAVLDLVRKHGMTFVAHSPQGGGFLHGRLAAGREGPRRSQLRARVCWVRCRAGGWFGMKKKPSEQSKADPETETK
ncbi:hypothetical protein NUW58_g5702 [Xylaria curta]|uniref:Uncharacterized protein n=1 Tax=Xylaria curta TaxID=42375 RepID=A0ACC1P0U9_9PEZI|nr:hypothetical protein NUW58_g5702 [Xylaria curta]